MGDESFNELIEQFLGRRLPRQMAASITLSGLPPDAHDFLRRMLTLMKRAGYSATEFTPYLIRWLSTTVPNILPGAWGGRIPPLTLPGRHKKFDDYIEGRMGTLGTEPPVFMDLGCGFPPVTSADTARRFPDWQIYGVDRSFADFVLYDRKGHYACFGKQGEFLYFQAIMTSSGRTLYADPKATRERFIGLFETLHPLLENAREDGHETVEKDGNRLIQNHIRDFETDNLTFVESDIENARLPFARVIRCMNLFIYFGPEKQKALTSKIGTFLDDGGLMIIGTNGLGVQSRYTVFRKDDDGILPEEFAFSLDNLGHIVFMPWFTIHEEDPEATQLADLVGVIRRDRSFWHDLSGRMDELLGNYNICWRGDDGFLHLPDEEVSPVELMEKNRAMWQQIETDGYGERAVDLLNRAGYAAWKNPAGDIAVQTFHI